MNRIITGVIAHAEQEKMNFCQPPQLTVPLESVKRVASANAQPPNWTMSEAIRFGELTRRGGDFRKQFMFRGLNTVESLI